MHGVEFDDLCAGHSDRQMRSNGGWVVKLKDNNYEVTSCRGFHGMLKVLGCSY
jgi:hypothetical protein